MTYRPGEDPFHNSLYSLCLPSRVPVFRVSFRRRPMAWDCPPKSVPQSCHSSSFFLRAKQPSSHQVLASAPVPYEQPPRANFLSEASTLVVVSTPTPPPLNSSIAATSPSLPSIMLSHYGKWILPSKPLAHAPRPRYQDQSL